MLWCMYFCCMYFHALFSLNLSIFLMFLPCPILFSDTPRGDLLHTLCCWSPFVQKHPPFELRHIITAFVDCCMILLILLLVGYYYSDYYIFIVYTTEGSLEHGMMFLTCSVWGEEHSSYRPTFGLLRFILLSLMFWWSLVHMMCTFVVPPLLLLSRACRTLVVWYVGDDGVVLWCLDSSDIVVWFIVDGDDANLGRCFLRDV